MTPLAVFVRALMKTSAIFIGATWIVLHPSLDWSSRNTLVTAQLGPRETALTGLRYALADQDPVVRRQAAIALARIRNAPIGSPLADPARQSRSVRELTGDLVAADAAVRTRAACDLREIGDRAVDAIQPLVAILGDGARVDPSVCGRERWNSHDGDLTTPGEQAARALVSIGSRAFDPVLSTLRGGSWVARRNAAWALGAFDDRRAVAPLMSTLKDAEPGVREQAAWALGALDDATAVPALVATLKDGDPRVRRQAAWATGALDDSRAVQALVGALRDSDAQVREQAAWALGAIGDRGGVEGLIGALKDENPRVREQAAWALGAIGDSAGSDALLPLLKDPDVRVRRQAAWAIGAIGR